MRIAHPILHRSGKGNHDVRFPLAIGVWAGQSVGVTTTALADPTLDRDRCYRAIESGDARFDGWFIVGVMTTGIYCRPSCPTPVKPKAKNVNYYRTAAAAQQAGFRACKRCRPDATPGSPEWNVRSDLIGRAMQRIADGAIDRGGVKGLAEDLAIGERHLHRLLVSEVGVGPLAIARAHRAQTARTLIETTTMAFGDVAFAAGFSSIRQFNDTVKEVFALPPRELRSRSKLSRSTEPGAVTLRLPYREPFDAEPLFTWLQKRCIDGLARPTEDGRGIVRSLRLANGAGEVTLLPTDPDEGYIIGHFQLDNIADLASAVTRCRRLLDLDADPASIAEVLPADARRGLRVPGTVDGFETSVFAILGQQISVAGAVTLAGRVAERHGMTPEALVDADLDGIGMTGRRQDSIRAVAQAWVDGVRAEPGADRPAVRAKLLELPGIGPWTVNYIALRAMADPDVFLAGDLIVRKAAEKLGLPSDLSELDTYAQRWAPWRSYATHYLWENS